MLYPQSLVDEIKERLSIVTLIGEYLPLKRAGRNFKGHCPFHKEKTPSFMVSDEKQIYHCFGCGEGGDVFRFLMKQEGWSFPEAIRMVAGRVGVTLPEITQRTGADQAEAKNERHRRLLFRVNQLAAEYYHQAFCDPKRGESVRNYLNSRGFKKNEFLTQHFLGCAEDGWDGLFTYLQERKVPMELAVELGLIRPRKEGGGYYDFFRNRLIFPIRGQRGEISGFGARALPDPAGKVAADTAKYLNSSDSAVYHKSKTVYGLAAASQAIRAADRVLVVEGYLDVLACQQAEIMEVVAPLGTALTEGHLRLLKRFTRNIWMVFDGDAAGRQAARRSLPLFLAEGLVPRVVLLPEGDDPDSFVQRYGGEALLALVPPAPTLFEWVIDDTVASVGTDTAGKSRAVEMLRPIFAQLNDVVEEAVYVKRLANRIGLDEAVVKKGLTGRTRDTGHGTRDHNRNTKVTGPESRVTGLSANAEIALLEFILQTPTAMSLIAHRIQPSEFSSPTARAIVELCWKVYEMRGELIVAEVVTHACDVQEEGMPATGDRRISGSAAPGAASSASGRPAAPLEGFITALAMGEGKYDDPETWPQLAEQLVAAVRRPQQQGRLRDLNQAIAQAEQEGRADDVNNLIVQKQQLLEARHGT